MQNLKEQITITPNIALELTDEDKAMLHRYVEAHDKISRNVVETDLLRVAEEARIMYGLCFLPRASYFGAEAIAHPQIDDKDPLRFFVTKGQEIIINPVITNHTKVTIDKPEGCMSYPDLPMINVPRWNKITVTYQTLLKDGTLSKPMEENINGMRSEVFQHETDHLDAKYIYKFNK